MILPFLKKKNKETKKVVIKTQEFGDYDYTDLKGNQFTNISM